MKKMMWLALCAAAMVACMGRGDAEHIVRERDALAVEVGIKDSLLNEVFGAVNAISENLESIRKRENILTLERREGQVRPVERINEDIAAIDRLLGENRKRMEALERTAAQLRKANVRIEGLERMIRTLEEGLEEKSREAEALKAELAEVGMRVDTLTSRVAAQREQIAELEVQKRELETDVADKTARLYTVHYIVGPQKELIDAQIVRKSGFIGKTLSVSEKRLLDSFTQSDLRFLEEVPVGQRGVTVVTSHPEDSYQLVEGEGKRVETLRILDPERFWESSKILVISYK